MKPFLQSLLGPSVNYVKNIFHSNPYTLRIVENLSWIFVDKAMRVVIGLFIGAWMARYLGPDQLGQLNYSLSFIALLTTFATLGLNSIVVRSLIVNPESANSTIGSAFFLQIIGSLFAWGIAIAAAYLIRPNDQTSLLFITVLGICFIFKPSETIKYWFESCLQSKYSVIAEGGAFLVSTILKCLLILISAPLIFFVSVVVLEAAISAVALIYFYSATTAHPKAWHYERETARELIKNCWPIILSGICVALNMHVDKIILMEYATLKDLGAYSVASGLVAALYFLPVAFGGSIAPRLTEIYIKNQSLYTNYARRAYIFFSLGSAIIALAICLLSNSIIKLLYGEAYLIAGKVLSIMIWGIVFVSLVSLRGRLLVIESNQKALLILVLGGTITNILLALFLIPNYGLLGAAYSFSISWGLNAFIFPLFLHSTKHHGFMAIGIKKNYDQK